MDAIPFRNKKTLSESEYNQKVADLIQDLKKRLFDITQQTFLRPNCIDGRDLDTSRPSIPGWWLGAYWIILASAAKAGADLEKVSGLIKDFFWWNLTGHTDDSHQHDPDHQCQWCGHVERLINQWGRYDGITEEISQMIRSESDSITHDHLDVLEKWHNETNVLIVDIPGKWIQANTWETQDFVYNRWYARDLYNQLLWYLRVSGINLDINDVMETAHQHFMTTGWDLAEGKDVFAVTDINDDNTPELQHLMVVPSKEVA